MSLHQPAQDAQLYSGGVLELVDHEVQHRFTRAVCDEAVHHDTFGPHLQVGEVRRVLSQQQLAVALETASQGGGEGPFGTGKNLGSDHLVADAVEIPDGLGHGVNPVHPPAAGEYAPVGAEDGSGLLEQKQVLFTLVQDPVAGRNPTSPALGASSR